MDDSSHPLSSTDAFLHWATQTGHEVHAYAPSRISVIDSAHNAFLWTLRTDINHFYAPPQRYSGQILRKWRPYILHHPNLSVTCSTEYFTQICALCASKCVIGHHTQCAPCHDRRHTLASIMRIAPTTRHIHPNADVTLCILRALCDLATDICAQMPGV